MPLFRGHFTVITACGRYVMRPTGATVHARYSHKYADISLVSQSNIRREMCSQGDVQPCDLIIVGA